MKRGVLPVTVVRLGYVAMSVHLQNCSPSQTMTFAQFQRLRDREAAIRKLERIAISNLENCIRLLKHNIGHDISFFRFSSKLIPLANHEELVDWDFIKPLKEKLNEIGQIEIIDSSNGSPGMVLLLVQASREIEAGKTFEEVVASLNNAIPKTNTFILLETLENVIKGGRLDRFKGTIANALNIRISLRVDLEGKIEVFEKNRGEKKALRRFIDAIGEYTKEFEDKIISLSHSNCEEKGKAVLAEIMERYPFKEGIITEMGPLIGTYAGEGGLVVSFQGSLRNQKV